MLDGLWNQVRACFETDDGSLPGVEIANVTAVGVAAIYAMIRSRSRLCGESPEFWSLASNSSQPVDSVANAAALVASGEAEAFHIVVEGLFAAGAALPAIGVFVFADSIELDYRMGRDWDEARVTGFFEFLRDCCARARGSTLVPAEQEGPPYPEAFMHAWSKFNSGRDDASATRDGTLAGERVEKLR